MKQEFRILLRVSCLLQGLTFRTCVFLRVCLSRPSSGCSCCGGLHNERQPPSSEEEQEEVEAAVVPPQRQGALHLHSSRGEGAQSLPAPAPKLSWLLKTKFFLAVFSILLLLDYWGEVAFSLFHLSHALCATNYGTLCALSAAFSGCCKTCLCAAN